LQKRLVYPEALRNSHRSLSDPFYEYNVIRAVTLLPMPKFTCTCCRRILLEPPSHAKLYWPCGQARRSKKSWKRRPRSRRSTSVPSSFPSHMPSMLFCTGDQSLACTLACCLPFQHLSCSKSRTRFRCISRCTIQCRTGRSTFHSIRPQFCPGMP